MSAEELFQAIGQVESNRLLRSEWTVQTPSGNTEEPNMQKKRINTKRIVRNILVAAIIVSMLAVTAYAVGGFLIFDSPEEMIGAIFGDQTGYDHSDGSVTPFEDGINVIIEPTYDRVPADEEVVAQEAAPLVSPVGQSISANGFTLTVDANLYDSVTKCGLLTYTLENPDGLDYSLQSTGEVWFPGGEVVYFSQYGYSYIIQDKSSDTRLTATYYYQLRDRESTDLEISLSQWSERTVQEYIQWFADAKAGLKETVTEEEVIAFLKDLMGEEYAVAEANLTREELIESGYDSMVYESMGILDGPEEGGDVERIVIPAVSSGEMTNVTLGNGAVTLSPLAIIIRMQEIQDYPKRDVGVVKIGFADGTEYVVKEDYTMNHVFAVGESGQEATYMFNRILDVKTVTSVTLDDGITLYVD